jgi:membrane protease YdiL (CAAX protease family)
MATTDALRPGERPPPPPRLPRTGPGFWWRVLSPPLAVLGSFVVAGITIAILQGASLSEDAAIAIGQTVAGLCLVGLGVLLVLALPVAFRRLALAWKGTPVASAGIGVGIGVASLISAGIIFGIAMAIDPGVEDQLDDLSDEIGFSVPWQQGLLVFALVILAPFGEELLFRALLLRGLVRRIPFWAAAVTSGALFAAAHPDAWQIWPRAVFLLAIGIAFAFLYRWRGYGASVTAHMTVNTAAAIGLVAG